MPAPGWWTTRARRWTRSSARSSGVTDLIAEIAAASQEQSSGHRAGQHGRHADGRRSTQQNAALVEQATAATESHEGAGRLADADRVALQAGGRTANGLRHVRSMASRGPHPAWRPSARPGPGPSERRRCEALPSRPCERHRPPARGMVSGRSSRRGTRLRSYRPRLRSRAAADLRLCRHQAERAQAQHGLQPAGAPPALARAGGLRPLSRPGAIGGIRRARSIRERLDDQPHVVLPRTPSFRTAG